LWLINVVGDCAMRLVPPSVLKGRRILIVESEAALDPQLQRAIEAEGGETILVPDPSSPSGATALARFSMCAAIVKAAHKGVTQALQENLPIVTYGANQRVPAQVDPVVEELRRVL
jgi:hypothetical protein